MLWLEAVACGMDSSLRADGGPTRLLLSDTKSAAHNKIKSAIVAYDLKVCYSCMEFFVYFFHCYMRMT